MRPSRVRREWAAGRPAICTGVNLTDPAVCELVSLLGFHCIWIDLEHRTTSLETVAHMMRAARVGSADVLARPGKGEFMRMTRLLETGAHGILYPRCDDAREAAEVVRWAKFAPQGERGFNRQNPDNPYGLTAPAAYVRAANAETFIAVQIESPAAAEQARAIAEVDGVDVVFFGPADFSLLSGLPGQTNADPVLKAREHICREALAAGKRFGTLCATMEDLRRCLDMGATFLAYGADITLLRQSYEDMQQRLAALGFVFPGDGKAE